MPKPAAPAHGPANRTVIAVIPARFASTRFPGKPLALIAGKPMIQHVYERASLTPSLSGVYVATDDDRIVEAVSGFGGRAILTGDHPTGTDRIAEAVETLEGEGLRPGWVMNVQGDEPVIDPADLERLITGLLPVEGAVMGTLVHPLRSDAELLDSNINKAVLDRQGRALYFSRSPIPHPRGPGELGLRHVGIYLYRRDFLSTFHKLPPTPLSEREQLEQLRALEHGYPIHCFPAGKVAIGVDVPADVQRAEESLRDSR